MSPATIEVAFGSAWMRLFLTAGDTTLSLRPSSAGRASDDHHDASSATPAGSRRHALGRHEVARRRRSYRR